jgi:hypothetical protein
MRRLSLGLVVVLLVWCVATLEGKADTVQWSGNGHWYEAVYVPERITWLNASATATGSGGYLATLSSGLLARHEHLGLGLAVRTQSTTELERG